VQESPFAFLVVIPEGDLLLFSCLSFRTEAEESAVHPCRRHASHRHSDRSEAEKSAVRLDSQQCQSLIRKLLS
jgi:hypothetical protein